MKNSQSQQASTNASVSTSHARKIYTNEEVELGISPPNTELDEGEFEDLDIDH
ncbi:hypothetical protein Tco_0165041, partial [Tanacetum coccineum]